MVDADVKKCSSCGEAMELNAAFCPKCGSRAEQKETQSAGGGSPIGAQLLALANDFLSVRELQPARFEFSSETGASSPAQKVKIKYDAVAQLDPENKLLTFWEKMVESSVGANTGFHSETYVQKGIDVTQKNQGRLLFGGKYGFEYGKLREVVKTIAEEQGWKFKLAVFKPKQNTNAGSNDSKKSIPAKKILLSVLALLLITAIGAIAYLSTSGGSKNQTTSQTLSQTEPQTSNPENTDVPISSRPPQGPSQTEPDRNNPENTDDVQSLEPKAFQSHGTVAGGRPFVETDKDIYTYGERIRVHFYNAPGYSRDWICIVRAGSRHTAAGNYQYLPRRGRGVLGFRSPRPGRYEVRAYYSYSPSRYAISARHSFTVEAR